jgi:hypothetical protein
MTQIMTISEKVYHLNKSLKGLHSTYFNNTVKFAFASPNDWFHAQTACDMAKLGNGYPTLKGDKWTVLVEMADRRIEEARAVVQWENHLWPLSNLVTDLPWMTDNTGIRTKKS